MRLDAGARATSVERRHAKPFYLHSLLIVEVKTQPNRTPTESSKMLRNQILRSLRRPKGLSHINGPKAFSNGARRDAEVQLEIGRCSSTHLPH